MIKNTYNLRIVTFSLFLFAFSLLANPQIILAQDSSWVAPKEAQKLENTLENSERVLNAGKQIYAQLCSVCHGKAGAGDGVTAAALNPKPADLTSEAVQEQTDGEIYWKMWEGRPPMPGFKSQLSEQQAWAIVHYIRSLNTNTDK
jgi:mono/diheme cytochrome c family protein